MNVVIVAWPQGDLERAAFDRAVGAATSVGHAVRAFDLGALEFRAAMPRNERGAYHDEDGAGLSDEVAAHVEAVRWADALVFVYPTTASTIPPPIRGWLERVMLPGVAFVFDDKGRVRPGLKRVRRIVGIATYPSSWASVKLGHDNGRRVILRALRLNTGLRTRTRWVACYDAGRADEADRERFLARTEQAVASL